MFKRSARTLLVAGFVLAAGLFATQSAQAQGFSINFGGGPGYYGGGFPGYGYNPYVAGYRGPAYNPYVSGYRGPVVNPYVSNYFPYNSYRTNVSPYIRHYGHSHCW
jgi:hypothetical protein